MFLLTDKKQHMQRKTTIWLIFFIFFIVASMICIMPSSKTKDLQYRSTDLIRKTEQEGHQTKTRFEDDHGRLTFAADLGYATKIITEMPNGRMETYYDEKGKPAMNSAGYYGIRYDNNQEGILEKIVYLNKEQKPAVALFGYAVAVRQYDDRGRVISEKYYDEQEKPICSSSCGNEKHIEYADDGSERITYLDKNQEPMIVRAGYASVIRRLLYKSTKGWAEEEFYYDEYGDPIARESGETAVRKEYDIHDLCTVQTFLGLDAKPVMTSAGYSRKEMTYYPDGSIETERYYDADGNPCALADGQFGIRNESMGRIVFLNADGHDLFNLKRLLYNYSWVMILGAITVMLLSVVSDKKTNVILLIIYTNCIIYLTLMNRDSNISNTRLDLFKSFIHFFTDQNSRTGIIRNIWLFIPLGTIVYCLYPSKYSLLFPFLLSIGIETVQLLANIGFFDLSDIVCNYIGSIIGFMSGNILINIVQSRLKRSRV